MNFDQQRSSKDQDNVPEQPHESSLPEDDIVHHIPSKTTSTSVLDPELPSIPHGSDHPLPSDSSAGPDGSHNRMGVLTPEDLSHLPSVISTKSDSMTFNTSTAAEISVAHSTPQKTSHSSYKTPQRNSHGDIVYYNMPSGPTSRPGSISTVATPHAEGRPRMLLPSTPIMTSLDHGQKVISLQPLSGALPHPSSISGTGVPPVQASSRSGGAGGVGGGVRTTTSVGGDISGGYSDSHSEFRDTPIKPHHHMHQHDADGDVILGHLYPPSMSSQPHHHHLHQHASIHTKSPQPSLFTVPAGATAATGRAGISAVVLDQHDHMSPPMLSNPHHSLSTSQTASTRPISSNDILAAASGISAHHSRHSHGHSNIDIHTDTDLDDDSENQPILHQFPPLPGYPIYHIGGISDDHDDNTTTTATTHVGLHHQSPLVNPILQDDDDEHPSVIPLAFDNETIPRDGDSNHGVGYIYDIDHQSISAITPLVGSQDGAHSQHQRGNLGNQSPQRRRITTILQHTPHQPYISQQQQYHQQQHQYHQRNHHHQQQHQQQYTQQHHLFTPYRPSTAAAAGASSSGQYFISQAGDRPIHVRNYHVHVNNKTSKSSHGHSHSHGRRANDVVLTHHQHQQQQQQKEQPQQEQEARSNGIPPLLPDPLPPLQQHIYNDDDASDDEPPVSPLSLFPTNNITTTMEKRRLFQQPVIQPPSFLSPDAFLPLISQQPPSQRPLPPEHHINNGGDNHQSFLDHHKLQSSSPQLLPPSAQYPDHERFPYPISIYPPEHDIIVNTSLDPIPHPVYVHTQIINLLLTPIRLEKYLFLGQLYIWRDFLTHIMWIPVQTISTMLQICYLVSSELLNEMCGGTSFTGYHRLMRSLLQTASLDILSFSDQSTNNDNGSASNDGHGTTLFSQPPSIPPSPSPLPNEPHGLTSTHQNDGEVIDPNTANIHHQPPLSHHTQTAPRRDRKRYDTDTDTDADDADDEENHQHRHTIQKQQSLQYGQFGDSQHQYSSQQQDVLQPSQLPAGKSRSHSFAALFPSSKTRLHSPMYQKDHSQESDNGSGSGEEHLRHGFTTQTSQPRGILAELKDGHEHDDQEYISSSPSSSPPSLSLSSSESSASSSSSPSAPHPHKKKPNPDELPSTTNTAGISSPAREQTGAATTLGDVGAETVIQSPSKTPHKNNDPDLHQLQQHYTRITTNQQSTIHQFVIDSHAKQINPLFTLLSILPAFIALYLLCLLPYSRIYHYVRAMSSMKLYVIYNMAQIFERLFTSLGTEILDWCSIAIDGVQIRYQYRQYIRHFHRIIADLQLSIRDRAIIPTEALRTLDTASGQSLFTTILPSSGLEPSLLSPYTSDLQDQPDGNADGDGDDARNRSNTDHPSHQQSGPMDLGSTNAPLHPIDGTKNQPVSSSSLLLSHSPSSHTSHQSTPVMESMLLTSKWEKDGTSHSPYQDGPRQRQRPNQRRNPTAAKNENKYESLINPSQIYNHTIQPDLFTYETLRSVKPMSFEDFTQLHRHQKKERSSAFTYFAQYHQCNPLFPLIVSTIYLTLHASFTVLQLITLNVALNSEDTIMYVIVTSNNFVELKTFIFKKYFYATLFQITVSDVLERFHLVLHFFLLLIDTMRYSGCTSSTTLKWISHASQMMLLLLLTEFGVDWCKHIFISKFNRLPSYYNVYSHILYRDVILHQYDPHHESYHPSSRRYGIVFLPIVLVTFRTFLLFFISLDVKMELLWLTITALCVFVVTSRYCLSSLLLAFSSYKLLQFNDGTYEPSDKLIVVKDDSSSENPSGMKKPKKFPTIEPTTTTAATAGRGQGHNHSSSIYTALPTVHSMQTASHPVQLKMIQEISADQAAKTGPVPLAAVNQFRPAELQKPPPAKGKGSSAHPPLYVEDVVRYEMYANKIPV